MTNLSTRRSSGFTLVELLVVIAIIAVLAAAGFAAGSAAIQRAKKTTTLNTATSIEQAVSNFYNEYGYLPTSDTDETKIFATDEAGGKDMLIVLAGKETADPPLNVKSINYLSSVKEGKKSGTRGRDGMIYTAGSDPVPDGIYDPWGGSYKIRLDLDYDDKLTVQPKGNGTERTLNARRVAVWSDGADGAATANGKATDDVTTW
jgi:prepilin-type N-terminal cleavage/methylation domain-containing protein